MTLEPKQKIDMHIKHLEMIQSNIARMNTNSASLKSYCVTLMAGIIALSAASRNPTVIIIALPMLAIFAGLDASYLSLERCFREQFNRIRAFSIDKTADFAVMPDQRSHSALNAIVSWSIAGFYGAIAATMIIVYLGQR